MNDLDVSPARVSGFMRCWVNGVERRVEVKVSLPDGSWYVTNSDVSGKTPESQLSAVAVKETFESLAREKVEVTHVEACRVLPPEGDGEARGDEKVADQLVRYLQRLGIDSYADLHHVHIPLDQPARVNLHKPTITADKGRCVICLPAVAVETGARGKPPSSTNANRKKALK